MPCMRPNKKKIHTGKNVEKKKFNNEKQNTFTFKNKKKRCTGTPYSAYTSQKHKNGIEMIELKHVSFNQEFHLWQYTFFTK